MSARSFMAAAAATTFFVVDTAHLLSGVAKKAVVLPGSVSVMIEFIADMLTWMFAIYLVFVLAKILVWVVGAIEKWGDALFLLARRRLIDVSKRLLAKLDS